MAHFKRRTPRTRGARRFANGWTARGKTRRQRMAMRETTNDNCPDCQGRGEHGGMACSGGGATLRRVAIPCEVCGGTGTVDAAQRQRYEAGRQQREERLSRRMTLREEAKRRGIKPYDLSRQELGLG